MYTMNASLGTLLTTLRQEYLLTVPEWAHRLGLPLERVQALEEDRVLPTQDELFQLCHVLDNRPGRLLRHIRTTGRLLLDRAWKGTSDAPTSPAEAVLALPMPLQRALCDALDLKRSDRDGLRHAWTALRSEPDTHRTLLFEAALAEVFLEGETFYPPLCHGPLFHPRPRKPTR
jgi:hypothetical protein